MAGAALLLFGACISVVNAEPRFFVAANGYSSDDVESWDVAGYEDIFGEYNLDTKAFKVYPGLDWKSSPYDDVAVAALGSGVYVVSQYRTAYIYSGNNNWRQLPNLSSVGRRHTSAVIDGNVYICGGCGCDPEKSCEYIDENGSEWKNTTRMVNNRMDHCVAVANGKMYAFAGRSLTTRHKLSIVESYDPSHNLWKEVIADFPTFTTCSATTYQDKIFVCGYNSGKEAQCVTLDPLTKAWQYLDAPFNQQLNEKEHDLGLLAVSDNRLFWFDASTNIYEYTSSAWKALDLFDPQSADHIPVDSVPRALVGF